MHILLIFFVLMAIQIPIALVVGITSIAYIGIDGNAGLFNNVPQRLYSGVESFSLLAIPLFMLAGELMNSAGITGRLIDFSKKVVGHFRGGLAYVNIIANMFLASILGSATAQTAMMSRVMVPEMEKAGYTRQFAAATTASAALLGPIIPPSMLFIIYAVGSGVSVGKMFLAGILPGILLAVSFILLIAYLGYKHHFPKTEKAAWKQIGISFIKVLPALSVPLIIVGGIISGIFTTTESAAFACFIAIIIGFFIYRDLKIRDFPKILVGAAISTSTVTLLIATANLFGWIMTFEQIPQKMVEFMGMLTSNPLVFLLMVNIFLLLIGIIMDEMAVLIVLLPIFMPLVAAFDIDPIHFGVVICINATIGLLTPPVGAGLFIASAVGEVKFETLTRSVLPFLAVALVVLMLITFYPPLTTWLPSLMK